MKNNRPNIDGFVPRRIRSQLGDLHTKQPSAKTEINERPLHSGDGYSQKVGEARRNQAIGRSDIDDSLREIDSLGGVSQASRRGKQKIGKPLKRRSPVKRIFKWLGILILLAGLIVGGYVATKFFSAGTSIFKGSVFDIIKSQPLKQDSNGRSNFLILGTSEDDPGHGGAYLTDSMMILSIDQTNKNAYMFSIPRDLYVQYGMACNSGYSGKINEYFNCVSDDYTSSAAEQKRLTETQAFAGKIFGLDIQYGIHVDNTVIKQAVDAVGGVDVDIEGSNGDPGVLDRNFDWRCNYKCYLVKYTNGVHHLDGEHALFLSMARGDVAPTYGLGNSNFDREKNQQKIIIALKEKATTTGTLTNIGKITSLMDALGSNLRTNIQTSEIRTLAGLAANIKSSDIHSISLQDANNSVVKTGNYNGQSIVMPAAGMYDYSEIQSFVSQSLSTNPVVREDAKIVVLNGSGVAGVGQTLADKLTSSQFVVSTVANAPDGNYGDIEIYSLNSTKTATLSALKSLYPKATIKTSSPPLAVAGGTSFVIVVGSANR